MRKLAILASLLSAAPLTAQDVAFRAGPTIATFTDTGGDAESRRGFIIGADLGVSLSENWRLRPGVFYVGKGADVSTTFETVEVAGGLSVDYLQLVLPVQRTFGTGKVQIAVQLGPWVAFEVGCEITASAEGVSVTVPCDEAVNVASSDIGVLSGVGLSYRLSDRASVGIDLIYHVGFTDVLSAATNPSRERTRTLALQVGVGLGS